MGVAKRQRARVRRREDRIVPPMRKIRLEPFDFKHVFKKPGFDALTDFFVTFEVGSGNSLCSSRQPRRLRLRADWQFVKVIEPGQHDARGFVSSPLAIKLFRIEPNALEEKCANHEPHLLVVKCGEDIDSPVASELIQKAKRLQ